MENGFKIFLLLLLVLSIPAVELGAASILAYFKISNVAKIAAVGVAVYEDSNLTKPVDSLNWGTLYPDSTNSRTLYLVSTGSVPSTLSLWIGDWLPVEATQYLSCGWNYSGALLQPNEVIPITFILTVSGDVAGFTDFSFSMNVTCRDL